MPTFSYIAIDSKGKQIRGTLEGESKDQVFAQLKKDGHTPVQINAASVLSKEIKISFLEKRITPRDLAVFCRQFVSIVSAGVAVTNAFEMLSEQTENPRLAHAIDDCRMSIQSGTSLSEAMGNHKHIFGHLFITMVSAGEESGSLDVSFARMAQQFEKEAKLKNLVKKATVYPVIIAIVAVIVVVILLSYVVPQFETMLSDLDMELPLITQIVVSASEGLQNYWYLLLGGLILAIIGIRFFAASPSGKRFFGRLELRLPLFGNLAVKSASARMSRTMATLLAAGIPITTAIDIVARIMSNIFFHDALMQAGEEVALGTPMSEPLARSKLFPPMVQHMTKIGEEVGDMEGMLDKVADYYDEEVEVATSALTAALEPTIIVVLAVVVGVIVLAVMLPLSSMYEGLGNL